MAWVENVETLENIGCCFTCGERNKKLLNVDHRRPQSMVYVSKKDKTPLEIQTAKMAHPFYPTVYDKSNRYQVDLEHHFETDDEKIAKFLGKWKFELWNDPETVQGYLESMHRGEPEALEQWLFRNYPWSPHPFYFARQRNMIFRNNVLYQEGVAKSRGYFPDFFVEKLERAAALVRQHNVQIHCMPSPSLTGFIDFGRFTPIVQEAELAA